ncbi:MAG: TonB-dependent receptor [Nannocystaceae bacterium]
MFGRFVWLALWLPAQSPAPPIAEPPAEAPAITTEPTLDGSKQPIVRQVRDIHVRAGSPTATQPIHVFRHAGARAVIRSDEARETGAGSLAAALAKMPGVRVVQGNAGLGSASTKLNLASRGVNPRFSSRTTVLLDEMPIATAPYGRPQLAMFPLSLFSIERVDMVLGGASARFGPHTSGGVVNLISRPVPDTPTIYAFAQRDRWGGTSLGAAYGGTHRGLGVYAEVAPRFGSDHRKHSKVAVHSGLFKLEYRLFSNTDAVWTNHGYWEHVQLPGGLPRGAYDRDPNQSLCPHDHFGGWRAGSSLKLQTKPNPGQQLQLLAYYHHTLRESRIAAGPTGQGEMLRRQPRRFDAAGLEPRHTFRLVHRRGPFHDLLFGARFAYEDATFLGYRTSLRRLGVETRSRHDYARILAAAGYIEDKFFLLDADLVFTAGIRYEVVSIRRQDRLSGLAGEVSHWAPLPVASLWYALTPRIAAFAVYERSFGPPHFLQIAVGEDETQLRPERADTAEIGAKTLEWTGMNLSATAWVKTFQDLIDVSRDDVDEPGDTLAWGMESSALWRSEGTWREAPGLTASGAYTLTRGKLITGELAGNRLPWYPVHAIVGSLRYQIRNGLYMH